MALFASLNVNGLRTKSKLQSILKHVHFDVLCVQETKWDDRICDVLTGKWHGQVHVSNGINATC